MKLYKSNILTICFTAYACIRILNLSKLLIIGFGLTGFASQLVSYFPLILLTPIVFFSSRKSIVKLSWINIWFITFFSYLTFGTIASFIHTEHLSSFTTSISYYSRILLELVCFYLFLHHIKKDNIKFILKYVTVSYFIVALSIPLFALLGFQMTEATDMGTAELTVFDVRRPAGLNGNANPAAFQSLLGLILILYWIFSVESKVLKAALGFSILLIMGSVVFTFSNTGMLGLGLVMVLLVVYVAFRFKGFYRYTFYLFSLLAIILYSLDFSFLDQINKYNLEKLDNFLNIVLLNTDEIQYSYRDQLLDLGISEWKKNPIFGSGLGYFKEKLQVHNTYLTILGESGVIPFTFFIACLLAFFIKGLLFKNRVVGFLFVASIGIYSLFCITLHNMVDQAEYHIYFMILCRGRKFFIT